MDGCGAREGEGGTSPLGRGGTGAGREGRGLRAAAAASHARRVVAQTKHKWVENRSVGRPPPPRHPNHPNPLPSKYPASAKGVGGHGGLGTEGGQGRLWSKAKLARARSLGMQPRHLRTLHYITREGGRGRGRDRNCCLRLVKMSSTDLEIVEIDGAARGADFSLAPSVPSLTLKSH